MPIYTNDFSPKLLIIQDMPIHLNYTSDIQSKVHTRILFRSFLLHRACDTVVHLEHHSSNNNSYFEHQQQK